MMKFSRLYVIALLVVVMISNCNATQMDDTQLLAVKTTSSRHLRGNNDGQNGANTEERGPNVDIIISDAMKNVKKATWWKVKHAWWKHILGKDTLKARKDLGMGLMGQEALHHPNAEELKAFRKMVGFKKTYP
ncbi:hypothetical protein P3T76_002655 [Phytophthora citrophthora]|uniref:RxLR effector protein n=1 Tax=Phytophthora citrophthora TaxID=4793 RepID=A0AAD9LSJ8_9STRA|nr:hypothetical protein P3T76_002655 [Phytophthora citrophthora]